MFIEGGAIASFSKALGSNVLVSFSSLASSILASWVTSETNVEQRYNLFGQMIGKYLQ